MGRKETFARTTSGGGKEDVGGNHPRVETGGGEGEYADAKKRGSLKKNRDTEEELFKGKSHIRL